MHCKMALNNLYKVMNIEMITIYGHIANHYFIDMS